eukprot:1152919-Amphidinium_carterae.1
MAQGAIVLPHLPRRWERPPCAGTLQVPRSLGYARSLAALGNASEMRVRYSASSSTGAGAEAPFPLRPPPMGRVAIGLWIATA